MEAWQRKYITRNLVSLISDINCSTLLLAYLKQEKIISGTEQVCGVQNGKTEQSHLLLEMLQTRLNGYIVLSKGLHDDNQTGAMVTLLFGLELNTEENPFHLCNINVNLEEILDAQVIFQGNPTKLKEICKFLENEELKKVIWDNLDILTYKTVFIEKVALPLAIDLIPKVVPYYINRTLCLKNQLDNQIFKEQINDLFLIESIELYKLTKLAQDSCSNEYIFTDKSSNQICGVSARFILLESESHFDLIRQKTNFPVHHIKYCDEKYYLQKSSGILEAKKFITATETKICQQTILKSSYISGNSHVIVYDTPGMGKSVLLSSLASQVKLIHPFHVVGFFDTNGFVKFVMEERQVIDAHLVTKVILDYLAENKVSRYILNEMIKSHDHFVHLFLDAFDEACSEIQETAIKILKIIGNTNKLRVYIATRPHKGSILEETLCTIGYGIFPFQEKDQIQFLVRYWQTKVKYSLSEDIKEIASTILHNFKYKTSTKERDIAGIPLQCLMLADLYLLDVIQYTGQTLVSNIRLSSIFEMYQQFISSKLDKFSDQTIRMNLYNAHVNLALATIFPSIFENVKLEPNILENIYEAGIVELRSGVPQFVHKTFAEFLIAEYAANYLNGSEIYVISKDKFFRILFDNVLACERNDVFITLYQEGHRHISIAYKSIELQTLAFKEFVLVYFLNYGIGCKTQYTKTDTKFTDMLKNDDMGIFLRYNSILCASLFHDFSDLVSWILRLHSISSPRLVYNSLMPDITSICQQKKHNFIEIDHVTLMEILLVISSQFSGLLTIRQLFTFITSVLNQPMGKCA